MAAVMRREIISPNLMEPNQLLIMHEQNIRSLLGSKEEKMEKTTLSRHSYRLMLLVFGCSLRLAMNHERTWRWKKKKTQACKNPSPPCVWRKTAYVMTCDLNHMHSSFLVISVRSEHYLHFDTNWNRQKKKTFCGCSRPCLKQPPLCYCTYFFVHADGFCNAELKVIKQKWKCVSRGFRIAVIREFFF